MGEKEQQKVDKNKKYYVNIIKGAGEKGKQTFC
jgi:hypothetical protein